MEELVGTATIDKNGLMSSSDKKNALSLLGDKASIGYAKIISLSESTNCLMHVSLRQKSMIEYACCDISAIRHSSNENNLLKVAIYNQVGVFKIYADTTENSIYCKVPEYNLMSAFFIQRSLNCNPICLEFVDKLPESALPVL